MRLEPLVRTTLYMSCTKVFATAGKDEKKKTKKRKTTKKRMHTVSLLPVRAHLSRVIWIQRGFEPSRQRHMM